MDLNKVTLIGNMVRDPQSRSFGNGQALTSFSIATNYSWRDVKTKSRREAVDFHDIVAWGRLADIIQQYVKKGSKIFVEGRLRQREYIAKDGTKRRKSEIVAENLIMLGHRAPKAASEKLVKEDLDVSVEE